MNESELSGEELIKFLKTSEGQIKLYRERIESLQYFINEGNCSEADEENMRGRIGEYEDEIESAKKRIKK